MKNLVDECVVPFLLAGGNPNWKPKKEAALLELVPSMKVKFPESHRPPTVRKSRGKYDVE